MARTRTRTRTRPQASREDRLHAERILVFAKRPEPGQVKTRLEPLVGKDGAAALHESFLRDVLARALRRPGSDVLLYHHPAEPGPLIERLGVALRPQQGDDLGERLVRAFADQERAGVERTVIVGSDSPDLPAGVLDQAFTALRTAALVLGPAVDGGFYLIGARGIPEAALAGVPWGSASVLAAVLANLRAHGLGAELLDVGYDVDRPEDLRFLQVHLDFLLETRGEDRCPATRRQLEALRPRP